MRAVEPLHRRLERKTERIPGGCWAWMGAISDAGYGLIGALERPNGRYRQIAVHRLAYALAKGRVPPQDVIHHTCRWKVCVNPAHLVAVTRSQHGRLHGFS
jgi:hypothetical protein